MQIYSRILAVAGILIGSSLACHATACPPNDDVSRKIEDLAANGKATFQNETYRLISKPETYPYYSGKLLENDTQLAGFLKVTKLLGKNLTEKAEAHLLSLLPSPNFCAYKISLGKDTQVIALSTNLKTS